MSKPSSFIINKQYSVLFLIIFFIMLLTVISSLIVKTTWFRISDDDITYIGMAAPLSGSETGIGKAMKKGINLCLEELNQSKTFHNRVFKLIEMNGPDGYDGSSNAEQQHTEAVGVISYMESGMLQNASIRYGNSDISVINTSTLDAGISNSRDWLYPTVFNITRETGFLANYIRNVLGKKIITIIHSDTAGTREMQQKFTEIYARFGTKIHYTYEFSQDAVPSSIAEIIEKIKGKKDLGTIFFAGDVFSAAHFVVKARDAGIKNMIAGTDAIASTGFTETVASLIEDEEKVPAYVNSMVVSVPLLYDTAGEEAQQFKNRFMEKYGTFPDWIAAYAYNAARLIIQGILSHPGGEMDFSVPACRTSIKAYLDSLTTSRTAFKGVTGKTWFHSAGKRELYPVQVGIYNGRNIIAAPTQLQPLKPSRSVNYFDALKGGRILYVNDRFMYKTNVIYTGIELHNITEMDMKKGEATLDLSIWFRYHGNFNPAEIDFLNAVEEISLDKPVKSSKEKNISFRLYRFKAPFKLDFLDKRVSYGSHLLGLSFHHKLLNRNNVIYVADVLGMGLYDAGTTLKQQLYQRRVLKQATGWRIDQAWLSQSILTTSTLGSPVYVGYGSTDPDFSRIDYGTVISEDRLDFRTFVDEEFLIYIGIFGLIGSLAAYLMDRRMKGFFWSISSWLIRLFFWPLVLLSCGNILVNSAIKHDVAFHYIHQLIMAYDMCWWGLPATLAVIALERFFWVPLEKKTQRKIPNLIRNFMAVVIYIFAFCGIIAFVLDQTLTSLLATSGLLTMIVGLAVQGNIANVFSGIIINLERPFSIGDWLKINDIDAVNVVNMTWRTVRLQTLSKHNVSIPNAKVADAVVVNYSRESIRTEITLHTSTRHPPDLINRHIEKALGTIDGINDIKPAVHVFVGIKPVVNKWVAQYAIRLWVSEWIKQFGVQKQVWESLWKEFARSGISLNAVEEEAFSLSSDSTVQWDDNQLPTPGSAK